MQDGWFVVSKISINKFDFYIVNFNKLISGLSLSCAGAILNLKDASRRRQGI